jgi:hypothetical protein
MTGHGELAGGAIFVEYMLVVQFRFDLGMVEFFFMTVS